MGKGSNFMGIAFSTSYEAPLQNQIKNEQRAGKMS
jgi:hypothetical protein